MRVLVLLLVLSTAVPTLAWAQMRTRGDRAVFGGGVGNAEQVLSISSNAGLSFYETLTAQPPAIEGERVPSTTRASRSSGSLVYRIGLPYADVEASVTGFSYYTPPPRKQWLNDYSFGTQASTGHTWQPSPRSHLSVNQGIHYRPAYQELLPVGSSFGTADPSQLFPPDVAAYDGQILSSSSSAGFNYEFSTRVALYSSYSLERYWNFGRDDAFDRVAHYAVSGLRVALSKHLSVRGGYRFDATQQGEPGSPYVRLHGLDVGIDYGRGGALRLTRRTTLSFGVGLGAGVDRINQQRYFALGNIRLAHEIGRTWSASAGYSRNVDFSTLFLQPALTDDVSADFGGLISSRLSFQSAIGYSRSAVGSSGVENRYDRAYGLAGLETGLNRYMALGVNYTYYYRTIGQALVLPSGLTTHANSQAVHVFVSAWAPLYQRMRRPNGTR